MSYIQKVELMQGSNTTFIHTAVLNTTESTVVINSPFDTVLYVIDLATDDVIYNPLHKGRGGTVGADSILLDFPMTGLTTGDSLLVAVDYKVTETIESSLEHLVTEAKITNKLLRKMIDG